MLAYQEWRELFEAGKLNEVQSQFFRTRPAEQLFNIESDPHETINLAGKPEYQSVLLEMRNRLNSLIVDLPDLSFFPESYLAEKAADNPVKFGRQRQQEIKQLVDIANLNTQTFADAKVEIADALMNPNAHARYWGLIVCSSFGKTASEFIPQAKLLLNDPSLLVRARAAEFLGLIEAVEPQPTIAAALLETKSPIEAMLILNTVVLLRDGTAKYDFEITSKSFRPSVAKFSDVQRRLEYLDPK